MPLPSPSAEGTCLVTGASAGIGSEIARTLARRGRGVTLVARRTERLEELAADLRAAHGVRAEVAGADLTDPASRAGLLAEVAGRGLVLDVLVNCAGVAPWGRVDEVDVAAEVQLARLNVEAVIDLCGRCTPAMVARGAGGILNVASTAAFQPTPNQASYGASKAFILSYTDAIGAELLSTGVHVTALCPGPVPTEIFSPSGDLGGTHPVDRVPRFMWREAPEVAEAGVAGLEHNRARAFKGAPNAIGAIIGQRVPRSRRGLVALAKAFTQPDRPNPARREP